MVPAAVSSDRDQHDDRVAIGKTITKARAGPADRWRSARDSCHVGALHVIHVMATSRRDDRIKGEQSQGFVTCRTQEPGFRNKTVLLSPSRIRPRDEHLIPYPVKPSAARMPSMLSGICSRARPLIRRLSPEPLRPFWSSRTWTGGPSSSSRRAGRLSKSPSNRRC